MLPSNKLIHPTYANQHQTHAPSLLPFPQLCIVIPFSFPDSCPPTTQQTLLLCCLILSEIPLAKFPTPSTVSPQSNPALPGRLLSLSGGLSFPPHAGARRGGRCALFTLQCYFQTNLPLFPKKPPSWDCFECQVSVPKAVMLQATTFPWISAKAG